MKNRQLNLIPVNWYKLSVTELIEELK